MKVLLAAAPPEAAGRFAEAFKAAGAEVELVVEPSSLGPLRGSPGAFLYRLGGEERRAELAVLATDTALDPAITDDSAFRARLELAGYEHPVVFVLDGGDEPPATLSALALRRALEAASRKRSVVVFARDFRTADRGVEALYREARRAGVSTVRCQAVSVSESGGVATIKASTRDGEIEARSRFVVSASVGASKAVDEFAAALRLKRPGGADSNGRYWLHPASTSRRGVYRLEAPMFAGIPLEAVSRSLLAAAARDAVVSRTAGASAAGASAAGVSAAGASAASAWAASAWAGESGAGEALKGAKAREPAKVDPAKCAFCYTCYRACPHAALSPDPEAAAMRVDPASCEACGLCAAICPAAAIEFDGAEPISAEGAARGAAGVGGGSAPARSALPASAAGRRGRLKIIACENSAYHAAKAIIAAGGGAAADGRRSSSGAPAEAPIDFAGVELESVPCCGSVGGAAIAEALGAYDGVIVASCVVDACRHFDGNLRCKAAAARLSDDLERLGAADRLTFCEASAPMTGPLEARIRHAIERIDAVGQMPGGQR